MRPELPYFAAGAIAIGGGIYRERGWPTEGAQAVLGTFALVIVASMTASTPIAPLVRAIGLLLLLTAVMSTVNAVNAAKKGKK